MSEVTRADLIAYCEKHGLKFHGNAGFATLKEIVDDHMASMVDEDSPEDDEDDVTPDETPETDDEQGDDQDEDTPDDDPSPETPKGGMSLLNNGKRRHMINGKTLNPGEGITLTAKECDDARLMAKVKTSLRCGVLVEVE